MRQTESPALDRDEVCSITVAAFLQFTRIAKTYLLPVEGLLQDHGLDIDVLTEGQARIPWAQVEPILLQLTQSANNEVIGLQASRLIDPGGYGIMGHIAMSCPRLMEVVERVPRFEVLISDLGVTEVWQEPGQTGMKWLCRLDDPAVSRQLVECVLGSWIVFARWLVNDETIAPTAVYFRHAAPQRLESLEEYRQVFRCPVLFNQAYDGFRVAKDVMQRQICYHDASLLRALELRALDLLQHKARVVSIAGRVRELLISAVGVRVPSREWVADRLGINPRTLYRWLAAEGTTYQALLGDLRQELAVEMLVGGMAISNVANQLGYSDTRSFLRAFKAMTGKTPTAYRNRLGPPKGGQNR